MKITGVTRLDDVPSEHDKRAMWRFPAWKRSVVMGAGVAVHVLFGFLVP